MKYLISVKNWFLRRNWFIKLWIILIIFGFVVSLFNNKTHYNSLSVGDCVTESFSYAFVESIDTEGITPTEYNVVKCNDPLANARVLYIDNNMSEQSDWTKSDWSFYAEANCPEPWTVYTYPTNWITKGFMCWQQLIKSTT